MKHSYLRTVTCSLIMISLVITATVGSETKGELPEHQVSKVIRIGVMPFFVGRPDGSADEAVDKTLSCSVSQLRYDEVNVKTGAGSVLTRLVNRELKVQMEEMLIPSDEVLASYNKIMQSPDTDTIRSLAKNLGVDLNAQKIVVGIVWRYRDRGVVADYSGTSPTSVAFAVYLVNVATGKREWRGVFDKTQRALTDDIAEFNNFFKMGVKWLTAEELARFGVKQIFKKFPEKPPEALVPLSRAMRSSKGGWVENRDINPPSDSGFTVNIWVVDRFASIGIRLE